MIVVSAKSVRKHFGPLEVLAGVDVEIRAGERVGLVGPNGTGKTTLLKILAGDIEPDAGRVEVHAQCRVEQLAQQHDFATGETVWDVARSALADLIQLAADVQAAAAELSVQTDAEGRRKLETRYERLQHELEARNGYQIEHKIERVLNGLGFPATSYEQPAAQLSGGEQRRLLLARLLLSEPDLMLLDEPSNHLDIETTQWLENYLSDARTAWLVVSHDRYFLDKVTQRTLELFHGTVDTYRGNFSAYWQQKAHRVEVQRRTFERQQTEISKLEDFVRRNQVGQKHAQAKDRQRKLDRIDVAAPPREIAAPPMHFAAAERAGDVVIRAERLAKQFDKPLFQGLTFDILRGQRWGIIGPNGIGKTTLLKCLLKQLAPNAGQITWGAGLRVGYCDQKLAGLAADRPLVDVIAPADRDWTLAQRRSLLARFGIMGDTALQSAGQLSGGERTRAALARVAAHEPNLIVLDEPTNHLDFWACAALEKALRDFDGTVLLVSHDRYFLNRVVDHLLVASCGGFRVVDGNYDMYRRLAAQWSAATSGDAPVPTGRDVGTTSGNRDRQARAAKKNNKRKRRFPYRKIQDLEVEILAGETSLEELQAQLLEPEVLRDGVAVKRIQGQIQSQRETLAALYEHFDEAVELN